MAEKEGVSLNINEKNLVAIYIFLCSNGDLYAITK